MRFATWNVNSIKVRLPQVLDWLHVHQPDVLALQETKVVDEAFPVAAFEALGYRSAFSGQKTYNGVALLSRTALTEVCVDWREGPIDPQRRLLWATVQGVRVASVYVPNGAALDSDKYPYKLDWLARLHKAVQLEQAQYRQLLLGGDFNIAPSDQDVHDPAAWQGSVLVSEAERAALQQLLSLGLQDCYRHCHPELSGFSWWDYRAAKFRRDQGLRIDLVLAAGMQCSAAGVDKAARAVERPSDHAPVWVEVA